MTREMATSASSTAGVSLAAPGQSLVQCGRYLVKVHSKRVERENSEGKKVLQIVPAGIDINPGMTRGDCLATIQKVQAANKPPSRDRIVMLLGRLYLKTKRRNSEQTDMNAMFQIYAEELKDYPVDVVEAILTSRRVWWPAVAEILDEADNHHLPRRYMVMKLEEHMQRMPVEGQCPPMSQPDTRTDEEIKEFTEQQTVQRAETAALLKTFTDRQTASRKPKGVSDDR